MNSYYIGTVYFTDLPCLIQDAPPNYYDIYPDKNVVEPSPVDACSPSNVPHTTTTATTNAGPSVSYNNTELPDLQSRIGTITLHLNEVSNML